MSESGGLNRIPTVLIADDEENIRLLVKACLKDKAEVIGAGNGVEAIQTALRHKPDLILLDVVMPVKDGLSVCDELKSNPQTRHIPIVMISGIDSESNRFLASTSGSSGYIMKPFSTAELIATIDRFLGPRPVPSR